MSEPVDLVDASYVQYIRPLGNLVILFAQAEAEFLQLVVELTGYSEKDAQQFLQMPVPDIRQEIIPRAEACGIEAFEVQELYEGIEKYHCDKGRRNRLIHDEWYVSPLDGGEARTRGFPRKKAASVVWGDATPDDVWNLCQRFRDYADLFSHVSYVSRGQKGS